MPAGPASEFVGRAQADDDGIFPVFVGLNHPLESGREVPVAGDREVGARTHVDAARPVADVVGAQTQLRIEFPEAGRVEDVLHVGADVHRAVFLAEERHGGLYAPYVRNRVAAHGAHAEDGSVAPRVGIDPDLRTEGPFAFVLRRSGSRHAECGDDRKKNLFHLRLF